MKGYRRISIIYSFLVAALLIGCGSNIKNEDIIKEEVITEEVEQKETSRQWWKRKFLLRFGLL